MTSFTDKLQIFKMIYALTKKLQKELCWSNSEVRLFHFKNPNKVLNQVDSVQ